MKYDLLLCDADKTLFDFDRAEEEALSALFTLFRLKREWIPTYVRINAACWAALERGETTQSRLKVERFRLFLEETGQDPSLAGAMDESYTRLLGEQRFLLPGAEDFCRQISRHMGLWLVTNGVAAIQHNRFENSLLAPYLSGIAISEEIGAAKPDPRMIFAVLEKTGVPASRVILMGDSLTADIAAARNAGIPSILFAPQGSRAAEPTYIVSNYGEAEKIILGLS